MIKSSGVTYSSGEQGKRRRSRPISPHLRIYRFSLTMAMSILHRITGGVACAGMALFSFWLFSAAFCPSAFEILGQIFSSFPGYVLLFVLTWALINHALGGVRHLVWDAGYGFGGKERRSLALATAVGSVGLTVIVWIAALYC